jgi:hypothetical protein
VNRALLPLFLNWRCYAARLGLTHYLVLAGDPWTLQALLALGEPAVPLDPTLEDDVGPRPLVDGTLGRQRLLLQRTHLAARLLKLGFWPIVVDVDVLFLQDPWPFFRRGCTVQTRLPPSPFAASGLQTGGGMMGMGPDPLSVLFWRQVAGCQLAGVKALQNFANIPPKLYATQTARACLRRLTRAQQSNIAVCGIPRSRFVGAAQVFDTHVSQRAGYFPIAIHDGGAESLARKAARLRAWDLWLVDPRGRCEAIADPIGSAPRGWDRLRPRLKVRVLASHRSQSLVASLQSLRVAAYGGDRVELEVLLVRPLGASAEWPAAVSVAEGIAWPHGQKTVTILAGSSDESGPWLQDPGLEDDGHLLLVLEPDVVVAPCTTAASCDWSERITPTSPLSIPACTVSPFVDQRTSSTIGPGAGGHPERSPTF